MLVAIYAQSGLFTSDSPVIGLNSALIHFLDHARFALVPKNSARFSAARFGFSLLHSLIFREFHASSQTRSNETGIQFPCSSNIPPLLYIHATWESVSTVCVKCSCNVCLCWIEAPWSNCFSSTRDPDFVCAFIAPSLCSSSPKNFRDSAAQCPYSFTHLNLSGCRFNPLIFRSSIIVFQNCGSQYSIAIKPSSKYVTQFPCFGIAFAIVRLAISGDKAQPCGIPRPKSVTCTSSIPSSQKLIGFLLSIFGTSLSISGSSASLAFVSSDSFIFGNLCSCSPNTLSISAQSFIDFNQFISVWFLSMFVVNRLSHHFFTVDIISGCHGINSLYTKSQSGESHCQVAFSSLSNSSSDMLYCAYFITFIAYLAMNLGAFFISKNGNGAQLIVS